MSHGMSYHVDVVFCIDATQSMAPRFSRVKEHVYSFVGEIWASAERRGRYMEVLRVRVIAFRDYKDRTTVPIQQSAFFSLPAEADAFRSYVASIHASGGITGAPKSGLEALTIAMQSAWTTGGDKRRHIIVLWTDGEAHPLEKTNRSLRVRSRTFADQIAVVQQQIHDTFPKDFASLTDLWTNEQIRSRSSKRSSKRLGLFAPDATPWTEITTYWDNVAHMPTNVGDDVTDVVLSDVVELLADLVSFNDI
jgi:hypothetical protein